MATTSNEPNQSLLTVSTEKLEHMKGLVQTLADQLSEQYDIGGSKSLLVGILYSQCKSFANIVESLSREKKIKASEIHRIDLRNGRVIIRPKKQSSSENNNNGSSKSRRKR